MIPIKPTPTAKPQFRWRSTSARAVRPIELTIVGDFKKPAAWHDPKAELKAMDEGRWHPSTEDFLAIANAPNRLHPHLVDVGQAKGGEMNLGFLFGAIQSALTNKKLERPDHSIMRVNLISHGGPGLISLGGDIEVGRNVVNLWRRNTDDPSRVSLDDAGIDELTIQWLNVEPPGIAHRNMVRSKLTRDAEIWLIICRGGGGVSNLEGDHSFPVGSGSNLARMLAETFQVKVKAFEYEVWVWPRSNGHGHIVDRDVTSIGKHGERGSGYYCEEMVFLDKARTQHLGAHMLKYVKTFDPHPGGEPFQYMLPQHPVDE